MSPLTIMVVDDDSDSRMLVEHRLRKIFRNCAVVACTSATEALCLFKYGSIDAIITDHHLGLESGAELIRQARRRGIACPILMVTGSADPRVEREACDAGATKVFAGGSGDFANFLRLLLDPLTADRAEERNPACAAP